MVLPEYIIKEESDECSEDGSSNSEDDDSDNSENVEDTHIPKGCLHGNVHINFIFLSQKLNLINLITYDMLFSDVEGIDEALLEMAYGGDKDDEYFEKFKKSISLVPEQIIR